MYKLMSSAKDTKDLSLGFDHSRKRRKDEFTANKSVKGKYHLRAMLIEVCGYAECQEKSTYGLGYKLTLTGKKDDDVKDKAVGTADARIKIDYIHWYVPHYTPSIQQQSIISNRILSKTPTELKYVKRLVFMKEINIQNLWNFELGCQESMNVPIWTIIGFQQRDRQDSQDLNNDTVCRLPVVSAQCIIGTEKYRDSGILLNSDDDY